MLTMYTIRPAKESDLEELSGLFDAYRVFYRKLSDRAAARAFLTERITKGDSTIFVAEASGHLAGFVQLYPLFSSTRMKPLWLLNDLFVSPEHRSKGLSKQLIDRSKQLCRDTGACGLSLETEKNNIIGNQLYPQTGFEADADHHYYFWENA